jgi:hypothetical protein
MAACEFGRGASLAKALRWEFWPAWAIYPPVVFWIGLLAMRHRGLAPIVAANPGLEDGGLVGESKFEILRRLPARWTISAALVPPGDASDRARTLEAIMAGREWRYPIVLKPDVGQRGLGVRRVSDRSSAIAYFEAYRAPAIAQPWHPGPFEAGIFYCRHPDQPRGRIFSITDKVFPEVRGDGQHTLEELIRAHPRYRLQAAVFLARHHAIRHTVPADGERVRLGHIGNHSQGALFRDGAHLATPAVEARIDEIARAVPGFFVGRFDIRYGDVHAFKAGLDLAIVELNGVTAESTNIYDPSRSLVDAYRTLFEQWQLIFEIGAANLARGARPIPMGRLTQLAWGHLTDRRVFPVAG